MYCRRNANGDGRGDRHIRELEREYASAGTQEVLDRLNMARIRAGMPRIVNLKLSFGYNPGLPPTATAAWGARMILRNGQTDLLHDRQDIASDNPEDRQRLIDILNGVPSGSGAIQAARNEATRLYNSGLLSSSEAQEFILYDDEDAVILGNTNASHGYLYVVAFLKPSDWITPPKTCNRCGAERISSLLIECSQCHMMICRDTCSAACEYCNSVKCHEHNQYAAKCASCEDTFCGSPVCERARPPRECKDCGRLYCYDCRGEISNCQCQDEEWCEECGEQQEECEDCGEMSCLCGCACDEDDEDEGY